MKEVRQSLRQWQLEAEHEEIEYLRNGGTRPLLAACPGAGKTVYGVRRACRFFNEEDGQLVIVIAPTTNIKRAWISAFIANGFRATGDVENDLIRDRLENAESIVGEFEVIVVTYAQLAKADGLFRHYPARYRTLVIADEVHHADDQASFGLALAHLADAAHAHLALSGTPFNTQGGALAMCDTEAAIDEEGRAVRRTIPFYTYSYADALAAKKVCRVIEFGIIHGKATTIYKSLLNHETFKVVTDGRNKTDSLRPFLDEEGDFLPTMLDEAIDRLDAVKQHHRRAAMLVVAQNTGSAAIIENMLTDRCGTRYSIQRIVHDTDKAHDRIERLSKDNTDIVITVRMVSEGIDVKRFRVGVYASDYLTQMFFIQFVGRFVRWDTELDGSQYAWMLFPGHVKLIEYAREIEKMIRDSAMAIGVPGGEPGEVRSLRMGTESEATDHETMARGTTMAADDNALLDQFIAENPDIRAKAADHVIVEIYKRAMRAGQAQPAPETERQQSLRKKNQQLVSLVVRLLKQNGSAVEEDNLFANVNGRANRAAEIRKLDTLTTDDQLNRRATFLNGWAQQLLSGADPESFE